ncbi:butyrophilin subfamily 3 member A2-like isoform X2 [Tyto alba]|uniref:butyrophilin subfamily 3 member A2-like isoform X2 n=1 Tax=Tyto alba TaxID=56313 RepID=UPI001C681220|nr:butyrophilin subfamily 3 member A2-like isoform X2 [Tyto alba]
MLPGPRHAGLSDRKMTVSSCSCLPRVTSSPVWVTIFFFGAHVRELGCARFRVLGPDRPITAAVGEDVVLPCHLSPGLDAENLEVRWFRTRFLVYVHLYRGGQDHYSSQMPEYQGRTEFLKEGLSVGNVSLKILRTGLSDEGQYQCLVKDGDFYEEAALELKVAVSGSSPILSVEDYQDGGIRVGCRATGWYPKPEMLWRDFQGQQLPSFAESDTQNHDGFFEVEKSIVIQRNTNQNVSCSVRSTRLPQEKGSTISISDPLFPKASPWMAALFVTLAACLASLVVCALLVLRLRAQHAAELGLRPPTISPRERKLPLTLISAFPFRETRCRNPSSRHGNTETLRRTAVEKRRRPGGRRFGDPPPPKAAAKGGSSAALSSPQCTSRWTRTRRTPSSSSRRVGSASVAGTRGKPCRITPGDTTPTTASWAGRDSARGGTSGRWTWGRRKEGSGPWGWPRRP